MEHKCEECEFEYAFTLCSRKAVINEFTGIDDNVLDRTPNNEGKCESFKEKA